MLLGVILLAGCKSNLPTLPTAVVIAPPTSTLAPILTMTQVTATLPPSDTPIPTITLTPSDTVEPPTDEPTIAVSPTPGIRGTVSQNATLRSGPAKSFAAVPG